MHEIFGPDQMAFNVCRTCTGSSDYSRSVYSFDESDEPDPELKKFSIDHDKAYIIPILKEARKLKPDLFLFSSPWSPPAWMKFNKSMLGGTIRKSTLEPYSRYIKMFLDAYQAEGVEINAVTIQNETDTTVDGRYPACLWAQEDEILLAEGRFRSGIPACSGHRSRGSSRSRYARRPDSAALGAGGRAAHGLRARVVDVG